MRGGVADDGGAAVTGGVGAGPDPELEPGPPQAAKASAETRRTWELPGQEEVWYFILQKQNTRKREIARAPGWTIPRLT